MNVFKKVPVPICAVILGMFGLGNLLQSYSEGVRLLCGAVGAVLMVMFLIRVLLDWKKFCNEMENPIMASVFCAFPMAVMMLATYVKPYIGSPTKAIWFVGVAIHVAMILYFTAKFVLHFSLEKVFASWFIVYVGIAMAGITAPAFGTESIGSACVWFGIVALVVLLILVTMRYVKKPVPDPAKPVICFMLHLPVCALLDIFSRSHPSPCPCSLFCGPWRRCSLCWPVSSLCNIGSCPSSPAIPPILFPLLSALSLPNS